MNRHNVLFSRLATLGFVLWTALASGTMAKAGQEYGEASPLTEHRYACSDRTIAGDYGWTAEGALIGVPGLPNTVTFRSIGTAHLDGKGNLSWLERTVINGEAVNSDFTEATGTYSINSNCTGSAEVYSSFSPIPLKLALVVVDHGKEFRSVLTTDPVTTVFKKIQ